MQRCEELKQRGNEAFRKGQIAEAVALYTQALDQLASDAAGAAQEQRRKMRSTLLCNRAAARLKWQPGGQAGEDEASSRAQLEATVEDCSAALEDDPSNQKALFRRAVARERLAVWCGVIVGGILLLLLLLASALTCHRVLFCFLSGPAGKRCAFPAGQD